jgi:radical SAM enzyme (TIGR01210 family)
VSPSVDARIRGLRPPKPYVDPFRAHGHVFEKERRPNGEIEDTVTVFLAGAECPFACSFCDLWQWTVDGPTPPGALITQLERVLDSMDAPLPDRVKLYNASNFFDPRAVPLTDVTGLARLTRPFGAVTVESHASMVGARAVEFSQSIPGRLEVAVGLETIHPVALAQSNKRLELRRFDQALSFLRQNEIDARVFVLLGAPHVPSAETVEWTVRSVEYAAERGASIVSIIPVRGGNGELDRLQSLGKFAPPTLLQLEAALRESQRSADTIVTVDLWDVDRLSACARCRSERVIRLREANLTGRLDGKITCDACTVA